MVSARTWIVGTLVLALTLLTFADVTWAAVVVVPNAETSVEGNSNNGFPFNCAAFSLSSQRYQQVYLGSEVGSGTITQIAFRPDSGAGAFGPVTIPGVTITLSSTTMAPDALSLTFASNVGADVRTVFSGNLTLQSAATGGPPRDFDIIVPLATPFPFTAAGGRNLLLDVTIPTCATTAQFDSEDTAGDSVSRTYTYYGSATSATADFARTDGLVTQFTFTATSSAPVMSNVGLALCVLLLLALGLWSFSRKRSLI